ncbi:hypothetical protein [Pseudotabrizicola algicola]|uniref:Uncharacterized protein n=1 Tax=Pseudotabrizicola algicola TaxID=2709381 RepID=A0A6B3RS65_9RHOB|nr:hypothetical protein [Pseudotabrizicola algicola]NEX47638.1 hypothetical protein [Pseudotabrizicola algicola]
MEHFDRYIWEAEAHANELLDVYSEDEREVLADWLERDWQTLLPQLLDPPKVAFVYLGEDPAERDRRIARLGPDDQVLLWVQARFLALRAARAMRLAQRVLPTKGWKYRKAARHAAECVSQAPGLPSPRETATLLLPG